jgi:hypothetical protein
MYAEILGFMVEDYYYYYLSVKDLRGYVCWGLGFRGFFFSVKDLEGYVPWCI